MKEDAERATGSPPVYDGLASARHATAKLVGLLEGEASADDKRRAILQAVLLA